MFFPVAAFQEISTTQSWPAFISVSSIQVTFTDHSLM